MVTSAAYTKLIVGMFMYICTANLKQRQTLLVRVITLKEHGPISQNGVFYSTDTSLPKKYWFQILVKSVKPFGYIMRLDSLQLPIPYCIKNYHFHSYLPSGTFFSSVKFTRGNEKNVSFLLIPKSKKLSSN